MPRSYNINQDGKEYVFTPGQGGSLIVKTLSNRKYGFDISPNKTKAKSVPQKELSDSDKRMQLAKSMLDKKY